MSRMTTKIPADADWSLGDLALSRKYGVTRQTVHRQRKKQGKGEPAVKWQYQRMRERV